MNFKINKWIILSYGVVGLIWVVWYPFSSVQSRQPTPSSQVELASLPNNIPIFESSPSEGENCARCHLDNVLLKTDLEDPTCKECHSGEEETENSPHPTTPTLVALPSEGSPMVTEMIAIPNGIFLMGSGGRVGAEGKGNRDEEPVHKVYVRKFYIDKYEITNEQYKAFVNSTENRFPRHWKDKTIPDGKNDHPVLYISWFEANDYCHWVGKRLPSEAEWEKAARGTEGSRFPWGNTFDPLKANTPQRALRLDQKMDTMPVGSFEDGKSPYGVYDMAGNVYEWTTNWYKSYPNNPEPNHHYGEKNKIVRGGSYYDCLSYGCGLSAPTFNRSRFAPIIRNKSFGFRCAKNKI